MESSGSAQRCAYDSARVAAAPSALSHQPTPRPRRAGDGAGILSWVPGFVQATVFCSMCLLSLREAEQPQHPWFSLLPDGAQSQVDALRQSLEACVLSGQSPEASSPAIDGGASCLDQLLSALLLRLLTTLGGRGGSGCSALPPSAVAAVAAADLRRWQIEIEGPAAAAAAAAAGRVRPFQALHEQSPSSKSRGSIANLPPRPPVRSGPFPLVAASLSEQLVVQPSGLKARLSHLLLPSAMADGFALSSVHSRLFVASPLLVALRHLRARYPRIPVPLQASTFLPPAVSVSRELPISDFGAFQQQRPKVVIPTASE
eukprot:GHVT01102730.1.p1 GENE.GHVT01102730.1~~GHVT01102730.1.p1  ORF type:complete len:316 (-),score=54.14 GHVT01102730.1:3641-4588(-)